MRMFIPAALAAASISLSAFASVAMGDSGWDTRIRALENGRDTLAATGSLDERLTQAIDGEIAHAREIAEESGTRTGEIPVVDLDAEVEAACAAYRIRILVTTLPSSQWERVSLDALEDGIIRVFEKHGITADRKFTSAWMTRIDRPHRQLLGMECAIGYTKAGMEARKKETVKDIRDIMNSSSIEQNDSHSIDAIISRYFSEHRDAFPAKEQIDIRWSSVASVTLSEAEKHASSLASARSYLGAKGEFADASALASSLNRSGEFERMAFNRLRTRLLDIRSFEKITLPNAPKIPSEPDMVKVFSDIDIERGKNLTAMRNGTGADAAPTKFDTAARAAISRGVKECADTFFKEGEKIRILAGDDPESAPDTAAKNGFLASKNILRDKIRKAHEYRAASTEFVHLVTRAGENAVTPAASYRMHIASLREMTSFIMSLVRESSVAHGNHVIVMRGALVDRERTLIETFVALSSLDGTARVKLGAVGTREALDARKDFVQYAQNAIHDLSGERTVRRKDNHRTENISAIAESNTLAGSVRAWYAMLENHTAVSHFFSDYASAFEQCAQSAESGEADETLRSVIADGSLLGALSGFDEKKITADEKKRAFLKKWIRDDLSRIKIVRERSARAGLTIPLSLSEDEMKSITAALATEHRVRIADWTMTPSTIRRVDANAAAWLAKRYANSGAKKAADRSRQVTISSASGSFCVNIPETFAEKPLDPQAKLAGKRFSDRSHLRTIHCVFAPKETTDSQKALEDFVSSLRMKIVKWHETGAGNVRTLSVIGSGNGDVVEAHARIRDGAIVIVAGVASRDRYRFFIKTIAEVNRSLE
jgi:hypothetical protein